MTCPRPSYPPLMPRLGSLVALALVLSACAIEAAPEGQRVPRGPAEEVDLEQSSEGPPPSRVADVVEEVLPSVVNVKVTTSATVGEEGSRGEGSGVVIDDSGVILTNNHVVQGAATVRVAFSGGRESVEGEVVGAIREQDLAVLRVRAEDLTAIELGSSERLRLGDEVLAIGFPLHLGGPTVTQGIISGRNRSIQPQTSEGGVLELDGLLQTDAAINPGNSGGALVDRAGRLVGINTAVAGQAENIGFAIPIDDALPFVERILSGRQEELAWLGVTTVTLTPDIAPELGFDPDLEGALITAVYQDSPAAAANLREGQLIVSVDGDPIASNADLTDAIVSRDPGETAALEVVTEGGSDTVTVRLDERPASFPVE